MNRAQCIDWDTRRYVAPGEPIRLEWAKLKAKEPAATRTHQIQDDFQKPGRKPSKPRQIGPLGNRVHLLMCDLKQADSVLVGQRLGISRDHAGQELKALAEQGFLSRDRDSWPFVYRIVT